MFIVLPCIVLKIDIHRHTGYEANVLKKKNNNKQKQQQQQNKTNKQKIF